IHFLSTPFDFESLALLVETLDVTFLKISSGDITNGPFLMKAARTGKSIILSTGMSTLGEIETALAVLAFGYTRCDGNITLKNIQEAFRTGESRQVLKEKVMLLQCTSEYPAPFEEVNLRVLKTLRLAFNLRVGLSDHTPGTAVAVAAVALGARIIEKHFTLDRNLAGPDHRASLEPAELSGMIQSIRQVETALGHSMKAPTRSESKNRAAARKSIVASEAIRKGDLFSVENLAMKRPGTGLSPMEYWQLLGKKADRDYAEDESVQP
ncbi:MAG: N-acetylneuraminate synthase, partial [Desulfobacteraceae bacterium]